MKFDEDSFPSSDEILTSDGDISDPFDDDLYKKDDPEDRRNLAWMPEVAREEELAKRYEEKKLAKERIEQRQKLKENRRLKKQYEERKAAKKYIRSPIVRGKSQQIAEIRKLRESGKKKASFPVGDSLSFTEEDIEEEEENQIDEIVDELSEDKEKMTQSLDGDEEGDLSGEVEEDGEVRTLDMGALKSIFLKRSIIEKWVNEPYFSDIVPGFFVRVSLGMGFGQRRYRLAQVLKLRKTFLFLNYLSDIGGYGRAKYLFGGHETNQKESASCYWKI